jgi:hypothetical protein
VLPELLTVAVFQRWRVRRENLGGLAFIGRYGTGNAGRAARRSCRAPRPYANREESFREGSSTRR